jgi:hypothetical protein
VPNDLDFELKERVNWLTNGLEAVETCEGVLVHGPLIGNVFFNATLIMHAAVR